MSGKEFSLFPFLAFATCITSSVTVFSGFTDVDRTNLGFNGTEYTLTRLYDLKEEGFYNDDTLTKTMIAMFTLTFAFAFMTVMSTSVFSDFPYAPRTLSIFTMIFSLIGIIIYNTNSDYDKDHDSYGVYLSYVTFGLSVVLVGSSFDGKKLSDNFITRLFK